MQRLTAIASILLFPTFVVGVYGQNFDTCRSCTGSYGYAFSWAVIILSTDRADRLLPAEEVDLTLVGTLDSMPFFICPNCKDRSVDHDGRQGILRQAVACERCGFGFLFELLDDYYPAPNTGLVACDRNGRILAAGRGVFELTGYRDADLMGKDVVEAFGLGGFEDGKSPIAVALEWGVRQLGEKLELRSRAGQIKPITADIFPAYDDDGGLLVALSPR